MFPSPTQPKATRSERYQKVRNFQSPPLISNSRCTTEPPSRDVRQNQPGAPIPSAASGPVGGGRGGGNFRGGMGHTNPSMNNNMMGMGGMRGGGMAGGGMMRGGMAMGGMGGMNGMGMGGMGMGGMGMGGMGMGGMGMNNMAGGFAGRGGGMVPQGPRGGMGGYGGGRGGMGKRARIDIEPSERLTNIARHANGRQRWLRWWRPFQSCVHGRTGWWRRWLWKRWTEKEVQDGGR